MALRGFKADRMGSDRPSMLDLLKATERDHGTTDGTPPSGIRRRPAKASETLGYLYCPPQSCRRGRKDEFADD